MKFENARDIYHNWWCLLDNNKEYVFTKDCLTYNNEINFVRGLLAMGAEWYPKIPPGFRLATAEDRKGEKPKTALFFDKYCGSWSDASPDAHWCPSDEYIVPDAKPEKVYTVGDCDCTARTVYVGKDFPIGAKVTVALAEDSAHGIKARQTDTTGGENR